MLRQDLRDICAGSAPAFEIPFGLQLVQRCQDRPARKLVLPGQLPAGGQLRSWHDPSVENLAAQCISQPVKRRHALGTWGKNELKA